MKTKSLLPLTCALGLFCLGGQANASLIVTNGDFQNLSGLSVTGGGWYGGVPTGWSGLSFPGYEIWDAGSGNYVANLQQLSNPTTYFSQVVGTTDFLGNVTLTFDLPATFGSGNTVGAVIGTGGLNIPTTLAFNTFIGATGTQTLTATNVAASTSIVIGFFYTTFDGGQVPTLDNVSISQVPEPSTWAMMLLGGVGMLAVLRRRSKQA